MRFLFRLFRFRTHNPGFFYLQEQADYEKRMEKVRTDPYYPFQKSA